MKYTLNDSVFHFICGELGFSLTIDLFVTRINTQLRTLVSYRPDRNCEKFYAFPPFSCLSKTLQKTYQDKAKDILIAPDWPYQPFYPRLIEMSLQIISIPLRKANLYLQSEPSLLHPLHRNLSLLACLVA